MDKFWEYLPLIIGLLYLFGRSKKKKVEHMPETETAEPEISVEEVLRELMGGKKKEVIEPKPIVAAVPEKKQPQKPIFTEYDFTPETFTYDNPEVYEKPNTDLHKPLKKFIDETPEPIEIDLREAVIYSTILDRPKY